MISDTNSKAGLTVVFAIQGFADTVSAALLGLAEAVGIAERSRPVQIVIVNDGTIDPRVVKILDSVSGAEVVSHDKPLGVGASYVTGMSHARNDLIWLGTDDTVLVGDALELMATRLEQSGSAMATPVSPWSSNTVIRKSALDRIGGFDQLGNCKQRPSLWFTSALAGLFEENLGVGAIVVPEARTRPAPGLPIQRTLSPSECDIPFLTVHSNAVSVGVKTFLGSGGGLQTYSPSDRIEIGHYCSVADGTWLVHPGPAHNEALRATDGSTHVFDTFAAHAPEYATTASPVTIFPNYPREGIPYNGYFGTPLIIGSDVWIGNGARVVGRVTVGDGAVVSAGSVVLNNVPPYAIVAGNPAKIIRSRFSPNVVAAMLRISWWEWPLDKVIDEAAWFRRPIAEFVAKFDPEPARTD